MPSKRRRSSCWLCKLTREMVARLERGASELPAARREEVGAAVAEIRADVGRCEECGASPWDDSRMPSPAAA